MHSDFNKILQFGDDWCTKLLGKVQNQFWQNVLNDWATMIRKCHTEGKSDIMRAPLWYNSHILDIPTFFPDWYKKGIHMIGDVINPNGKFLTIEEMIEKFSFYPNIINYFTVKIRAQLFIKKYEALNLCSFEQPTCPFYLDLFLKSRKGWKIYHRIYNKQLNLNELFQREKLWTNIQDMENTPYFELRDMWTCAYKICFKSISDNDFIWFQYRVLFRILGTKYRLEKFNISQSDVCSLCTEHPETIDHLFCFCTKVTPIWDNIQIWIKNKLNINIRLTEVMKSLGYCIKDENFWPMNFILMITRRYIFWCSRKGFMLDTYSLQRQIKKVFLEQKTLYQINFNSEVFNRRWTLWEHLFIDID